MKNENKHVVNFQVAVGDETFHEMKDKLPKVYIKKLKQEEN